VKEHAHNGDSVKERMAVLKKQMDAKSTKVLIQWDQANVPRTLNAKVKEHAHNGDSAKERMDVLK